MCESGCGCVGGCNKGEEEEEGGRRCGCVCESACVQLETAQASATDKCVKTRCLRTQAADTVSRARKGSQGIDTPLL